jgi:hypothetical protein
MKKYTVEQLKEIVREVNAWDDSLEEFDYNPMDELDEILVDTSVTEILRMAHFGEFDWNDDYFTINVYGNLDSLGNYEYEKLLKDNYNEIVERYNELLEDGEIEPIEFVE